jgi:hypothetical protein
MVTEVLRSVAVRRQGGAGMFRITDWSDDMTGHST